MTAHNTSRYSRSLDLTLVALLAIGAPAIGLLPEGSVLRVLLVSPFVFFLPGYLLMIALFPSVTTATGDIQPAPLGLGTGEIGTTERIALAFGFSLILLPLFGFSIWALGRGAAALSFVYLSGWLLVLTAVAWFRRRMTPQEDWYIPHPRRWILRRMNRFNYHSPRRRVLGVMVLISIVMTLTVLTVGLAAPQMGESYTEFGMGSVDADGAFVLGDVPNELTTDDPSSIAVLVTSHEDADASYTVSIELHQLDGSAIAERESLDTFELELEPGERAVLDRSIQPTMVGDDLRLTISLESTDDSTVVDQTLHAWVDVTE